MFLKLPGKQLLQGLSLVHLQVAKLKLKIYPLEFLNKI